MYGADGRLNSKFLLSIKEILASIAGLADELRDAFPLQLGNAISGISRTYAYLHLLYHQVSDLSRFGTRVKDCSYLSSLLCLQQDHSCFAS